MHIPNPLGSYPLSLREHDIANPRVGELMLNYENYDLYYNHPTDGLVSISRMIYKRIIAAKLENTYIQITHSDDYPHAEEPVLPDIADRKVNTFYINIIDRETV